MLKRWKPFTVILEQLQGPCGKIEGKTSEVVLSHTDRLPDIAYHRCLLLSGVTLEYDHHFRTYRRTAPAPPPTWLRALVPSSPTRSLWEWTWLLKGRGVSDDLIERILSHNPRRLRGR